MLTVSWVASPPGRPKPPKLAIVQVTLPDHPERIGNSEHKPLLQWRLRQNLRANTGAANGVDEALTK